MIVQSCHRRYYFLNKTELLGSWRRVSVRERTISRILLKKQLVNYVYLVDWDFWEGGPRIIDDNPNWPCQKLEVHIDL